MNPFKIIKCEVGQLHANCYIFKNNKTNEAVIIDPGDDAEYIIDKLTSCDANPLAIVATHGHFDHVGGALTLQLAYNIPFYLSSKDGFFLKDSRKTAMHFTGYDPGPVAEAILFGETNEIKFGTIALKVINVPGHTPGSIALYSIEAGCVFVGDIIFADGSMGEWKHKYSDKKKLISSIDKILKLPEDTIVYSGHGEETTIKNLRERIRPLTKFS